MQPLSQKPGFSPEQCLPLCPKSLASPQIVVRPFQPADQPAVKTLILAGLSDHWRRLDPDKNPDLDDVATSYAGATFLVAYREDELVGTGALVPLSSTTAEIKRMSVAAKYRRQGIGRLLLDHLLAQARSHGCDHIQLETTATWQQAINFYQKAGFRLTHFANGDAYFRLDLSQ
jgi:ribosomal protein S18 acetylase RimI-like enzyme